MSQPVRKKIVADVTGVIKDNFLDGCHGLFDTRNIVGDPMETIYEKDGVSVDICRGYQYFEVFGLTDDEMYIVGKAYRDMQRR